MSTQHMEAVLETNFEGVKEFRKGKVRDVYEIEDKLLIVATDRISAFDCVCPNGIPGKGIVLSKISQFWFFQLKSVVKNHLITMNPDEFPKELSDYKDLLKGRSMLVKKTKVFPVECVVRGYLAGSGWKEYQKSQTVCGEVLPKGLVESSKLEEPIFTPATKADTGHDENISFQVMCDIVGKETGAYLKNKSLEIYRFARDLAFEKGIIIADTKFEFGLDDNGDIILIDEVLTPDSSRFWPLDEYRPGQSQPNFDKQFVRDYLNALDWDKTPPAPALPVDIVEKTSERYLAVFQQLTGYACQL
ncbi:phosphoribosylaminoimidazolesuccinocarboxamide synthase [PVC group bacterium]|nr:phosphoribosylaminoimidazolesuccinocarboxamide synthase [PVC group bacterium]